LDGVSGIEMLGYDELLDYGIKGDSIVFELPCFPPDKQPYRSAWTFKFHNAYK